MLFIENVPAIAIDRGTHRISAKSAILIQITEPDGMFPVPMKDFQRVFQFRIWDVVEPITDSLGRVLEPISDEDAQNLVLALQYAQENNLNVVVHCAAGICRSGAVTEIGTMLGFQSIHDNRLPNQAIKYGMMKALGLTYDS